MSAIHKEWRESQSFSIPEESKEDRQDEPVPNEAGNVWFVMPEPEDLPLTTGEAVFIYGCILLFSLVSLACIAAGTGWIYQRFFN